jgi:hypothetical protein
LKEQLLSESGKFWKNNAGDNFIKFFTDSKGRFGAVDIGNKLAYPLKKVNNIFSWKISSYDICGTALKGYTRLKN